MKGSELRDKLAALNVQKKDLATRLGKSPQALNQLFMAQNVKPSTIQAIEECLGVKLEDPVERLDLIPDLPIDAAAGFTEDLESGVTPEMCRMLPKLPGIGDYDLTITVRGNSMEPAFSAGDRLAIRRCRDVVEWGAPHVVDCEDGVYIKRVEDQGEAILCSSDNPIYKPFPIPKPTIRALYKVIALFRTY